MRRTLFEAAWHYRHLPHVSETHKRRQAALAPQVCQIDRRAEQRLSRRMHHLLNKGKSSQKMVAALARELVGFVRAIGQDEQQLSLSRTPARIRERQGSGALGSNPSENRSSRRSRPLLALRARVAQPEKQAVTQRCLDRSNGEQI